MLKKLLGSAAMVTALSACAATPPALSTTHAAGPSLEPGRFVASDGYVLPVAKIQAQGKERAVVVAVHGINDYGAAWERPAQEWAKTGVTTYAYDQRGFGRTEGRGQWHGKDAMISDLGEIVSAVKAEHPRSSLYVVAESLGGAVALAANERGLLAKADGLVLSSPAVWSRSSQGAFAGFLRGVAMAVTPGGVSFASTPGKSNATDDPEVVKGWWADPHTVKETRMDVLVGATELMDEAVDNARMATGKIVFMYGGGDAIIPNYATEHAIAQLKQAKAADVSVRKVDGAPHLLMRSLGGREVIAEVQGWIGARTAQIEKQTIQSTTAALMRRATAEQRKHEMAARGHSADGPAPTASARPLLAALAEPAPAQRGPR